MFGIGTGELLIIAVIAMLIAGPERIQALGERIRRWRDGD